MKTINSLETESLNLAAAAPRVTRIPLVAKLAFTSFMVVLVPVYWSKYGPTNFLYFCDLALFVTMAAVWLENGLLASMAAVGIILPQLVLWCGDFVAHLIGIEFIGMTDYMFDATRPLFLRGLSFFHGWLPFLLLYLVARLGYDRRALPAWTGVAWGAMLVSYFFLPPAGAHPANPLAPVNVDYVYGFNDAAAQTWMPGWAWLAFLLIALPALVFFPTHRLLGRFFGSRTAS